MDILVVLCVVVLFFGIVWYFFGQSTFNTTIVGPVQHGSQESSAQEEQKTEVSYSCWIRIDDFNPYGKEKVIFVKGSADTTLACPALVIDAHTNSLLVKVDTFGGQEIVAVSNIPAKKWVHIVLTLNEKYLTIYVNGVEYETKYLTMLPASNTAEVLSSPNGGFSGRIANLNTYPRVLSYDEVVRMSKETPSVSEENQAFPPYFAESWFRS